MAELASPRVRDAIIASQRPGGGRRHDAAGQLPARSRACCWSTPGSCSTAASARCCCGRSIRHRAGRGGRAGAGAAADPEAAAVRHAAEDRRAAGVRPRPRRPRLMRLVTSETVATGRSSAARSSMPCAVSGANILRDMREAVVNTLGGHMTKYEALLDKTIARALDALSERAREQGYDGVLGIRISHPHITSGAIEVVVAGTGFRYARQPAALSSARRTACTVGYPHNAACGCRGASAGCALPQLLALRVCALQFAAAARRMHARRLDVRGWSRRETTRMALKAPGILDLPAVDRPGAGRPVLALLRRDRSVSSPATPRSSTAMLPPTSCWCSAASCAAFRTVPTDAGAAWQKSVPICRAAFGALAMPCCQRLYLGDGKRRRILRERISRSSAAQRWAREDRCSPCC